MADQDGDIADSFVTLCVHGGIAAADVICCVVLGKHALGESHNEAIILLAKADKEAAKYLSSLFKLKSKSAYSHLEATSDEIKRASRAAEILLDRATRAHLSIKA